MTLAPVQRDLPPLPACACGCGEAVSRETRNRPDQGRRVGDPLRFIHGHANRGTARGRFWGKVDKSGPDGCWLWTGRINGYGYGTFRLDGRGAMAHRYAYEVAVGPIPEGLVIDHLCRNRACVNPAHLEPVTPGLNVLRGFGAPAQNARKTHCKHGHPFDDENTVWRPTGGRACLACRRTSDKAAKASKRAAAKRAAA